MSPIKLCAGQSDLYGCILVLKPLAMFICWILVQKSCQLMRSDSSHSGGTSGGTSRSLTIKVNLMAYSCAVRIGIH
jgi:hypothetical protein